MHTPLFVLAIVGAVLVASGVLLIVFKEKLLRRGKNWQIWSVAYQRNRKLATPAQILLVAIFCLLVGLVFLISSIQALIRL